MKKVNTYVNYVGTYITVSNPKKAKKKTWKPCFNTSHEVIMYIFFVFWVNKCGLALRKKIMILWHEFCFIKIWVPVSFASSKRHKAAPTQRSQSIFRVPLQLSKISRIIFFISNLLWNVFQLIGIWVPIYKKNLNGNW